MTEEYKAQKTTDSRVMIGMMDIGMRYFQCAIVRDGTLKRISDLPPQPSLCVGEQPTTDVLRMGDIVHRTERTSDKPRGI